MIYEVKRMEKRQLGTSNLFISKLGLGCMSIGTDEKQAFRILESALEEGINYFDTADLYDYGQNEKLVGSFFKQIRENVIIATKVGNRPNEKKDGWSWDPSKKYIKEAVKASLKRLNTEYIDLYQLHGGTINDPIEETIEAFEELKTEGFIRYYGISSIRPNVIREYVNKSEIISVMMQYSLLDRRPEEEALPLLHENNIGVVTRGPIANGLLTEQMLEKASKKVKENGYLDYSYRELFELLPRLKEELASTRSFTEVALQFNLSNSSVTSVIVGASSPQQVRANAQAIKSEPLSQNEVKLIQSLTKGNKYTDHR